MKTKGLELNVNDLIDEVIRLAEEKMLAEAKVDRQQGQIDAMADKLDRYEMRKSHDGSLSGLINENTGAMHE